MTEDEVIQPLVDLDQTEEYCTLNEIKASVNSRLKTIIDRFDFARIDKSKSFKTYKNREAYHFTIIVAVNMDNRFLYDTYQTKCIKFPINFDIDVENTTKSYIGYILDEVFGRCDQYLTAIKNDYNTYKEKGSMIV